MRLTARLDGADPTADDLAELGRFVEAHPFRETPRVLSMLALYRCGRQAEALEVFRQGRRLLRDELGVEPGPALQEMHRRILRADPGLSVAVPSCPAPVSSLPADPLDFSGREAELGVLMSALLCSSGSKVGGITGSVGSGRTYLAVRTAQSLITAFPDGQLYGDAGGAGGLDRVLREWLRLLGAGPDVPATLAGRVAAFGALAEGRRLLLVVDNADDTALVSMVRGVVPEAALLVTAAGRLDALPEARWVRLGGYRTRERSELFAAAPAGPA